MSTSAPPKSFSYGDPRLPERFWAKVQTDGTCWVWTAARTEIGYAKYWQDGRALLGHRVCWEALVDAIPPDGVLDHICRQRACVFPGHLTVVTGQENTARGASITAQNAAKQYCDRGHPLFGDNVYTPPGAPTRRMCRTCVREAKRASYRRNPIPAMIRRDRMRDRRPDYNRDWKRDARKKNRPPSPWGNSPWGRKRRRPPPP